MGIEVSMTVATPAGPRAITWRAIRRLARLVRGHRYTCECRACERFESLAVAS